MSGARRVNSDEDCILCALGVGHYDLDDQAPFKDGKPGWHRAGASIWNCSGAVCIPHAAIEGSQKWESGRAWKCF